MNTWVVAVLGIVPALAGAGVPDGSAGSEARPGRASDSADATSAAAKSSQSSQPRPPDPMHRPSAKGSKKTASFPQDIFTEPKEVDPDTLANLGPLRRMAGVWVGRQGKDEHPVADGGAEDAYVERMELQPIDPQLNGPQLLYGLRYHIHIVKPGEVATFHDQVGYWLWEPATKTVIQTVAIPRAQVAMAAGKAEPDAGELELVAKLGAEHFGICSSPFLQTAFRTVEFRILVRFHPDGTWSYEEDTVLKVRGRKGLFHHRDRNTLTKVAEPTPNPLAAAGPVSKAD